MSRFPGKYPGEIRHVADYSNLPSNRLDYIKGNPDREYLTIMPTQSSPPQSPSSTYDLRTRALEAALRANLSPTNSKQIIEDAQRFENYLLGVVDNPPGE